MTATCNQHRPRTTTSIFLNGLCWFLYFGLKWFSNQFNLIILCGFLNLYCNQHHHRLTATMRQSLFFSVNLLAMWFFFLFLGFLLLTICLYACLLVCFCFLQLAFCSKVKAVQAYLISRISKCHAKSHVCPYKLNVFPKFKKKHIWHICLYCPNIWHIWHICLFCPNVID